MLKKHSPAVMVQAGLNTVITITRSGTGRIEPNALAAKTVGGGEKTMANKTCLWCGRSLPPKEFHKDKNRKDGLQTLCMLCNKYRTMYKFYGTKSKKELTDMINERKVRNLLMEMKINTMSPKVAVGSAVQMLENNKYGNPAK